MSNYSKLSKLLREKVNELAKITNPELWSCLANTLLVLSDWSRHLVFEKCLLKLIDEEKGFLERTVLMPRLSGNSCMFPSFCQR